MVLAFKSLKVDKWHFASSSILLRPKPDRNFSFLVQQLIHDYELVMVLCLLLLGVFAEGGDDVNVVYLVLNVLVILVVEKDGLQHDEPAVYLMCLYEI